MFVSHKGRYALRALFELAKRTERGHTKIVDIAAAQTIPHRFLEVILGELKQGGFVESRRGSDGGYLLARSPATLTVGEVLRFLQGSFEPVDLSANGDRLPPSELYAFRPLWSELKNSVDRVLDSTTFRDLLENETRHGDSSLNFTI